MAYKKLIITAAISFVIMYGVMFLNVASYDHIYLSTTRFYMAVMMVSPMQIMMVVLMKKMYTDKKLNMLVIGASIVIFVAAFFLLRNQAFIEDRQYMKAMIPHHSSAIMTSKHASIKDPEVKALSEQIIASQEREITEMKAILERLDSNP